MSNNHTYVSGAGLEALPFEIDTLLEVSSTVDCSVTLHKEVALSTTRIRGRAPAVVPVEAGSRIIIMWSGADSGHIVIRPIDASSNEPSKAA